MKTSPLRRKKPFLRSKPMKSKGLAKRTRRKSHNVAEQAHLDAVHALGCYGCWRELGQRVDCQVHHSKTRPDGTGYGTVRASHFETFGLCERHHANYGKLGVALHAGRTTWIKIYGSELDAVAWANTCVTRGFIMPPPLVAPIPALRLETQYTVH